MFAKLTILLLAATLASAQYPKGLLGNHKVADSERKVHKVNVEDLPTNVDWGNMNGRNYLTQLKNQHIPQYCGSCWAQSTTSMISDRISIMRQGAFPEIQLSAQILLDYDTYDSGCHGGDFGTALKWIHENHLTEENCSQYRAEGHEQTDSNTQPMCKDCVGDNCFTPDNYHQYQLESYTSLAQDEATLMHEIATNGPIACSINAEPIDTADKLHGFTGVFSTEETGELNHAISLVGYGVDETTGEKYWRMRNSWGEYAHDNGFIKILRGVNMIGIESDCWAATPLASSWENNLRPVEPTTAWGHFRALEARLTQAIKVDTGVSAEKKFKGSYKRSKLLMAHKQSAEIYGTEQPANFNWGDVEGQNYLTKNVNQHIPQYCGSCWAQSAMAAMSARINIMQNNYPKTFLAVQVLLNCGIGSCTAGGDALDAYAFAQSQGIPERGCQNYIAADPTSTSCSAIQRCMDCPFFGEGDCFAVEHYTNWRAAEYGAVSGEANMMAEIHNNGPIACGVGANMDFYDNYTGGVYVSPTHNNQNPIDHQVAVVGWGTNATDGDYWVVQNSWGSYWGESGFFRIPRNSDYNLNIEQECRYVIPQREDL